MKILTKLFSFSFIFTLIAAIPVKVNAKKIKFYFMNCSHKTAIVSVFNGDDAVVDTVRKSVYTKYANRLPRIKPGQRTKLFCDDKKHGHCRVAYFFQNSVNEDEKETDTEYAILIPKRAQIVIKNRHMTIADVKIDGSSKRVEFKYGEDEDGKDKVKQIVNAKIGIHYTISEYERTCYRKDG